MAVPANDSLVIRRISDDNIGCLQQGAELIGGFNTAHFTSKFNHCYHSSIGEHFRHILDHYQCLIAGFKKTDNNRVFIDYDRRQRDPQMERDPERTIAWIARICGFLEKIPEIRVDSLAVKMDTGSHAEDQWASSSLSRELQFLLSHTVHHYALITTMNVVAGVKTPEDFGIAPSTLAHRRKSAR